MEKEYYDFLFEEIEDKFNGQELHILCFFLGLRWDDLDGVGKRIKIKRLLAILEQQGRIDELAWQASRRFPDVPWREGRNN